MPGNTWKEFLQGPGMSYISITLFFQTDDSFFSGFQIKPVRIHNPTMDRHSVLSQAYSKFVHYVLSYPINVFYSEFREQRLWSYLPAQASVANFASGNQLLLFDLPQNASELSWGNRSRGNFSRVQFSSENVSRINFPCKELCLELTIFLRRRRCMPCRWLYQSRYLRNPQVIFDCCTATRAQETNALTHTHTGLHGLHAVNVRGFQQREWALQEACKSRHHGF